MAIYIKLLYIVLVLLGCMKRPCHASVVLNKVTARCIGQVNFMRHGVV